MTSSKSPATPEQVAKYGKTAARLRALIAKNQWSIPDLCEKLGCERSAGNVYHWFQAKHAPGRDAQKKLAELTGEDWGQGVPRKYRSSGKTRPPFVELASAPAPLPSTKPNETLIFTALSNGMTRIKLDIQVPTPQAIELFRLLLDVETLSASIRSA
jgi:transcriptional regulator with XRE-family HTH domain